MPSCFGIVALVFGLIVVASHLAGQDATDHDNETGRTQEASADEHGPPDPFSIPVRIIEDREPFEDSKRGEDYERNLRERSLLAQEEMNRATQSVKDATWWMLWASVASTLFVAIGTGLLIWTLRLTRHANEAAQAAVDVTRIIGEAQVRAYLTIKNMMFGFNETHTKPRIKMTLSNTGQSPARQIEIVFRFSFFPLVDNPEKDWPVLPDKTVRWWFDEVPGGDQVTCMPTDLSDVMVEIQVLGENLERLNGVHVNMAVFAEDVFGKEVNTFGHFAVGWAGDEDRREMKPTTEFTTVSLGKLMIEELRPYRLGHEKDERF